MIRTEGAGTQAFFADAIIKDIVEQMDVSLNDVAFTGAVAFTKKFTAQLSHIGPTHRS
jgi:hypothetical protein